VLVELDAERRVRAVADEDVDAGIDRRAGKGAGEIRRLRQLALRLRRDQARVAIFVAVKMEYDPVGLPPRLLDPAQVVGDVGGIAFARDLEAVAAHERLVQESDGLVTFGTHLGLAEEMLALARALLFEAELAADAPELIEGFAVDRVGVLEPERVDPRPPAQVGTLRARPVPGPERRRSREDRDAPAAGVEVAGHTRLGEVCPAAGMGDASDIEMPDRCHEPAFAIVEGMIVGTGDHV